VISSSERQISNCFATRSASGEAPAKAAGQGRTGLFWLLGASFGARARFGEREVQREAVPCSLHYLSHCTLPALAYEIENHLATCSITSRTRQSSGKRSVSIIIARTRDRPSETGRQGKAGRRRYSEAKTSNCAYLERSVTLV
jgi:hypothetical protein